ncbi:hypothetical protein [Falsiruegeria litorea]|uniref:hypothetical protein n=1 Tax=Falsiruegeria litorea TaxID=1280831 RepID=UPI001BFDD49D|nr:hypothetical protein [Falsiruegeria litorea]MBT8170209.1 hypothetical protein [Falsiruegeria litorea]
MSAKEKSVRFFVGVGSVVAMFGAAFVLHDPEAIAKQERIEAELAAMEAEEARVRNLWSWVGATHSGKDRRLAIFAQNDKIVMRALVGGNLRDSDQFVFRIRYPNGRPATCDERNGNRNDRKEYRDKTTSSCVIAHSSGSTHLKGEWKIWAETIHGPLRSRDGGKAEWTFSVQ